MGRLWYVPFKKHDDPVSMEHNWTHLEEYLNSPQPTCPICGEPKSDVADWPDPFVIEGICEGPDLMYCCNDCYHRRCMEI